MGPAPYKRPFFTVRARGAAPSHPLPLHARVVPPPAGSGGVVTPASHGPAQVALGQKEIETDLQALGANRLPTSRRRPRGGQPHAAAAEPGSPEASPEADADAPPAAKSSAN